MARAWLLATIAAGVGCSGQPNRPPHRLLALVRTPPRPPSSPKQHLHSTLKYSKRWTWQECGGSLSGPIVLRAKYAPDGKTVAIQFEDGSIVLKTPDRLTTGVILKAAGGDFAFSRDGSRLAVLGKYPSIFQTSDGALLATMSDPAGQVCGTIKSRSPTIEERHSSVWLGPGRSRSRCASGTSRTPS